MSRVIVCLFSMEFGKKYDLKYGVTDCLAPVDIIIILCMYFLFVNCQKWCSTFCSLILTKFLYMNTQISWCIILSDLIQNYFYPGCTKIHLQQTWRLVVWLWKLTLKDELNRESNWLKKILTALSLARQQLMVYYDHLGQCKLCLFLQQSLLIVINIFRISHTM